MEAEEVPSLRRVTAHVVEKLVITNETETERQRERACRVRVKGRPGTKAGVACQHIEV